MAATVLLSAWCLPCNRGLEKGSLSPPCWNPSSTRRIGVQLAPGFSLGTRHNWPAGKHARPSSYLRRALHMDGSGGSGMLGGSTASSEALRSSSPLSPAGLSSPLSTMESSTPPTTAEVPSAEDATEPNWSTLHCPTSAGLGCTPIGVLGGGQLGRMLCQAASPMGIHVLVLDPQSDAPASRLAYCHVVGSFQDKDQIAKFAKLVSVLTVEIEHVDTDALDLAAAAGADVEPRPSTLRTIQDKLLQKQHFAAHGVPLPAFAQLGSMADVRAAARRFGFPLMLKSRRLAYDGRGNAVARSEEELEGAVLALGGCGRGLYAEQWAPYVKELAVMVARGRDGTVRSYPVVETTHRRNICHTVEAPAAVPEEMLAAAMAVAERAVGSLDGAGVFGVELFLLSDGQILLNEVAPRPHNSGHYTIEACATSQYEQHLRAVLGLPLGDPGMKVPAAAMLNILGEEDGDPGMVAAHRLLHSAVRVPGASVHWYEKPECRAQRKMGHITVIGPDSATVRARMDAIVAGAGVTSLHLPWAAAEFRPAAAGPVSPIGPSASTGDVTPVGNRGAVIGADSWGAGRGAEAAGGQGGLGGGSGSGIDGGAVGGTSVPSEVGLVSGTEGGQSGYNSAGGEGGTADVMGVASSQARAGGTERGAGDGGGAGGLGGAGDGVDSGRSLTKEEVAAAGPSPSASAAVGSRASVSSRAAMMAQGASAIGSRVRGGRGLVAGAGESTRRGGARASAVARALGEDGKGRGGGIGPLVGIIMGSDSDLPVMKAAADVLEEFGVEFELTIVSAHRTPERMFAYARDAHRRGVKVIVAGAGGAAHLPGMVAAMTPLPVIGVPVRASSLDGLDSLLSIVQMPRGVPVATVAINNATNAGLLAARILGAFEPRLLDAMVGYQDRMEETVEAKAAKLEAQGWRQYLQEAS